MFIKKSFLNKKLFLRQEQFNKTKKRIIFDEAKNFPKEFASSRHDFRVIGTRSMANNGKKQGVHRECTEAVKHSL